MKAKFIISAMLLAAFTCCPASLSAFSPEDNTETAKDNNTSKNAVKDVVDGAKQQSEGDLNKATPNEKKEAEKKNVEEAKAQNPEEENVAEISNGNVYSLDQGNDVPAATVIDDNVQLAANSSGSDYSGLALLLSLAALAVAGFALFKLKGKNEKELKKPVQQPMRASAQQPQVTRQDLNNITQLLTQQDDLLEKLRTEVIALKRRVDSMPQQGATGKDVVSNDLVIDGHDNKANMRRAPKAVYKYASFITSSGFADRQLSDTPTGDTLAVFEITGNTATFTVNDDPACAASMLNNVNYGIARIANILDKSAAPRGIVNVNVGHATLQNGNWVIDKKADVRLV